MVYLNGKETVRCGYCYGKGHNRNGCQQLKDYVKNNPTSYTAEKYNRYLASAKQRTCSYCKEGGHNRKKCSKAIADIVSVAEININFRKKFIETMNTKGIGPGALLKVSSQISAYNDKGEYHNYKDQLCLVTGINLNNVFFPSNDYKLQCINVVYCNVYEYNGTKQATGFLDMPYWFAMGNKYPTSGPPRWTDILDFTVVSPGYFICPEIETAEKQESWIKDYTIVDKIVYEHFNNHNNLQNKLKHLMKIS